MQRFSESSATRRNLLVFSALLAALTILITFAPVIAARPQSQDSVPASRQFTYDVVSVKMVKPGTVGAQIPRVAPDGFTARNVTLMRLLYSAFGIAEDYRFSGLPEWGRVDRFDVEAKSDDAVTNELQKLSPGDRRVAQQHMQQAVLVDRFKLTFHSVMKEVPVYFLVVAKNGPKFHDANPNSQPPAGRGGPIGAGRGSGTLISYRGAPVARLVDYLSFYMERPVVDKTELTGTYDFIFTYGAEESQDAGAPPMETALEEQLGLKLVSGKDSVEFIVIDHVEHPSGN